MEKNKGKGTTGPQGPEKENATPKPPARLPALKTATGLDLSIARKIFCKVLVDTGDSTLAAIRSGYTGPHPEAVGSNLKTRLRPIWEPLLSDRLADLQIKALSTLETAMESKDERISLAAAKDIMDRGQHLRGIRQETGQHDDMTEKQLIELIARKMGRERAAEMFPDLFPPDPIIINPEQVN